MAVLSKLRDLGLLLKGNKVDHDILQGKLIPEYLKFNVKDEQISDRENTPKKKRRYISLTTNTPQNTTF
ncbi:hypothetical protein Ciccas_006772 [Cichlidogyrus casuarinus]|uniref:Uncharacterized protein n=1 Tax=Cichlidogyrus casuarinus TaxID=1844966 RepID=A0ABD2Q502_9PLAT